MSKSEISSVIIIPALNEVDSIELVISHIPAAFRRNVVVVDNGSTDGTAEKAKSCGAHTLICHDTGYGSACLAGIAYAKEKFRPDIYIFLDADYSDYPEDMDLLVNSLLQNDLDMVIGSRLLGLAEPGALLPQARFGNWLATTLMSLRFGYRFTDLGPEKYLNP